MGAASPKLPSPPCSVPSQRCSEAAGHPASCLSSPVGAPQLRRAPGPGLPAQGVVSSQAWVQAPRERGWAAWLSPPKDPHPSGSSSSHPAFLSFSEAINLLTASQALSFLGQPHGHSRLVCTGGWARREKLNRGWVLGAVSLTLVGEGWKLRVGPAGWSVGHSYQSGSPGQP